MSAQIRGWAHAVKKQRIIALVFVRIVLMARGVNGDVRSAAAIKFREKQTEPGGMFVVDGDRFRCGHVGFSPLSCSSKAALNAECRAPAFLCVSLRKPLRPLRLKSPFRQKQKGRSKLSGLRDLCMYDYVNPYHKMKSAHSTAYNNNTRTRSLPRNGKSW